VLAILMFVALLILVFLGQPLAFTLGSLAVIFGLIGVGPSCFGLFANRCWGLMTNEILVAVPLFIFMAQMLDRSGVAERLFESMHIVLGRLRGGLLAATIVVCTIFAATTGIIGASVVAMGLLAAPAMLRRKYDKGMVAGAVCAGGTLGILIPPSIMLIVYGGMRRELTVGELFAGAVFPGLTLSGLYLAYILIRCGINPKLGPPLPPEDRTHTALQKLSLVAFSMVPPLGLIFAVLGTILLGIATPTEAAGMGAFGAIILALIYRKLTWKSVYEASLETLKTTSMIMLLFVGGSCFSVTFIRLGGDVLVEDLLLGIQSDWAILAIMMAIVFLLGMFIDWLGILLVCVPVFQPIATDILEFDALWFSLLVCINLQMSFLTPPFGYALFYFKGVAPQGVSMGDIYRGIWPFVLLQMVGLIIVILIPELVTWLPGKLFAGP
jgi:tripartite ATP-independent transporter DctM subunit